MSKSFFYKLMIGLVVTCFIGTQCLYAQNVIRYESKGKGAWENAGTWEVVTRDSQGNVVNSIDAAVPPQPSDDVVVNHPISVDDRTKQISSLTVTGSGLITSGSSATDIAIEVENDITIENGGRISTTGTSEEGHISSGDIELTSKGGDVTINGRVETGDALNAPDTSTSGGSSGNVTIRAESTWNNGGSIGGSIVIGERAIISTGRGGNGAESNDGGNDATNGGNSGNIRFHGSYGVAQRGTVLTGNGGNGGDAGANGGEGGNGGHSGSITVTCGYPADGIELSGPTRTGDGGNGGNSKADDQDAGHGGDSGNIYVDIDTDWVWVSVDIRVDNSDISQGQAGFGGSAKGTNASAGTDGRPGGVQDASDQSNPCPNINGEIIYISLENPKSGLEGALCNIESQSDVIINGLHEEAIVGEFGVTVSAPGVIDLTNVVAGKNMIISPAGEIVFHVSDADNIWLAQGMSLAEITEPDAIVIEDLPIAYIVIDDFESYSNYPPNEVFMTWIDGWSDPTNGSSAGYPEQDFTDGPEQSIMETEIVHTGRQSMPFFYDNSVGLSEVTRSLNDDWTREGVDTLTLWYHGVKDNAAEPMYIALNGIAIVTNDDATAALITEWTQWNIPLQDFVDMGVDLANVYSMSIGFGNKFNPTAGGDGHVFFDDIRLYLPKLD